MTRGAWYSIGGLGLLLALAACGGGFFSGAQRAAWRGEAELTCLKSGNLKLGSGIVQAEPIEGPGVCGAEYPLKVAAIGGDSAFGYTASVRPPGSIPGGSGRAPDWPDQPRYQPPQRADSAPPPNMRWVPGPPSINAPEVTAPYGSRSFESAPSAAPPMSITPDAVAAPEPPRRQPMAPTMRPVGNSLDSDYMRAVAPPSRGVQSRLPDDIPDDAVIPREGSAAVPAPRTGPVRQTSARPRYQLAPAPQPRAMPNLGPSSGYTPLPAVEMKPQATLACPLVSSLDRWISDGVQPAALHWFNSPVVSIRQISAYACRRMVGAGGHGISEHAFGNAIDVAAFTFADGRTITVQKGWHGSPEEQGFLRDVHLYACETFNTVLGPGYNAAHYNHFHFDLSRRASGKRPCRPTAIRGEIVAARVRAHYASKQQGSQIVTGSIGAMVRASRNEQAVAGEDGLLDDEPADVTGSIDEPVPTPVAKPKALFNLFGWKPRAGTTVQQPQRDVY